MHPVSTNNTVSCKFTMFANKTELSDNYFQDLYQPPEGQGMDGGGGGTHRKSILILHIM